jgi:hypothetical protein
MMPRNLGALFCGMAAVALLVAGFMPWFATHTGEHDDDDYSYRRVDEDADGNPILQQNMRANFGLVSGELCVRRECKSAKYTGAPGLADDAFAWLGRATLGAALSGVALLIATALAARSQRRPILRGWTVTVVGAAAGLGAAFAAIQSLDNITGNLERGMGLGAVVIGAALAGLGAAMPWGPTGARRPAERYGLAAGIAVLASLAWLTLILHAWWKSGRTLDVLAVSPLGVEICEDGECRLSSSLSPTSTVRLLACLTSLCAAAVMAPAFGTASRLARGVAPGAWGWSAAVLAWLALGLGVATWAAFPANDSMVVGWGLPIFAVAMAGTGAASVVGVMLMRTRDDDSPVAEPAAPLPPGAVAPGAKPVLAALGAPVAMTSRAPNEPAFVREMPPAAAPAPAAPLPQAKALAPPTGPTAAALLAKKTSPMCPTCRVATLWHGKRGAWWCSTCKQTV